MKDGEKELMNKQTSEGCSCTGQCRQCRCMKENEKERTGAIQRTRLPMFTAMVWLLVVCHIASAGQVDRPGLLIIAHGSPAKVWNQPVLEQEQKVREGFGRDNPYTKIKVVFMEFAEPNVADGLEELQAAGCTRIVVVPLLIAPSSHSHWDIPALLGIYGDPEIEAALREEGLRLVRPKVPVTLTPTMAHSDVIEKIVLKRVRQLSRDSKNEALVLLAHGSEAIPSAWERFLKRTVTYACGQTGISYGDWATIAVGQEYDRAVAAIQEAAEHRDRVIVVGVYLSLDAGRIHNRWLARVDKQAPGMHGTGNSLQGLDVQFAEQGLLPDALVTEWIVETAREQIKCHR